MYFEGPVGLKMNYEVIPGVVPEDTIFIHGNLGSNTWWYPSVEIWKARSAKNPGQFKGSLILAEWRGCGKSGSAQSRDQFQVPVLARDYIALAEHLKLSKVNLVGHSTGGIISLLAMSLRPDIFSRAVLLDSVSASGLQIVTPEVVERFKLIQTNREFLSMALAGTIYGEKRPDAQFFEQVVNDAAGTDELNWTGVIETLNKLDFWNEVKSIQNPVLVLHGEFDMVLPLEESEKMAKALPHGRFQKLDGQGHSCNVENPERFVGLVDQFLFEGSL